MTDPRLHLQLIRLRAQETERRSRRSHPELGPRGGGGRHAPRGPLTLRLAAPDDRRELTRLAELDSAVLPDPPLVIAELDGRLVAAVSLTAGTAIADPFVATVGTLALLRLRALQLGGDEPRRHRQVRARLGALPAALLSALPGGGRRRRHTPTPERCA